MADRYWVGGTGNWDNTAKWSTTSGGAGGASVPVAADAVIFNTNSNSSTADFTVSFPTGVVAVCASITCSSSSVLDSTATFDFLSSTGTLTVSGNLTVNGATSNDGILFAGTGASTVSVGGIIHNSGAFGLTGSGTITSVFYSSRPASQISWRFLFMGTSGLIKITQTGTTTPWDAFTGTGLNLTTYGNGIVEFTGALASGNTRTVVHIPTNSSTGVGFKVSGGVSGSSTVFTAGSSQTMDSLEFTTGYAGSWLNSVIDIVGSLTLSSTMSVSSGSSLVLMRGASGTIITAGKTCDFPMQIQTGTYLLGDALTLGSTRTLTHSGGTFNANGFNVTVGGFSSTSTNTRSLLMGTGTWTLLGTGTVWNLATTTGLTFTKSTANIILSDTSVTARTFAGGGLTYNNITIGGSTGISTLTLTGSNTFNTFASTKTVAHTILFTAGTTTTVTSWTITGTVGNVVTLGVSGSGTFTLTRTTAGPFQLNYLSISNGIATPSSTWYVGTTSTNGGNNTGFIFGNFLYWIGGTGTWSSSATTNWSTTSGGTSSGTAPAITTDVYFDANSDSSAIFTVTISTGATCNSIIVSGLQFTMTLAGTAAWSIGGSMTLPATLFTRTYTGDITFTSATANTITTSGVSFGNVTTFNGTGSWTLGSAFNNTSASIVLTAGTLSLSSYTLTAGNFVSSNPSTRTIAFGTGKIVLTSTAAITIWDTSTITNLTTTGTQLVEVLAAGTTTRTISAGQLTNSNSISFSLLLTAAGTITFTASNTIRNLIVNMATGTLTNIALTIYGNITTTAGVLASGSNLWSLSTTSALDSKTIRSSGLTWNWPIRIFGVGGTWTVFDSLTVGSAYSITFENGTFDANNKNIAAGNFISNGTSIRSILMGTGTWTLSGTGTVWNLVTTNLTFTASSSTIVLSNTSTTARTFAGGGLTYNNLTIGGATGTSTLTLTGSNTFNTFASTKTVAHTILFTGGTTTTFTSFTVTGTAGNVVTIGSTNTTQATIAKPTAWYVGGNSINGGNNTNLLFGGGNNLDYLNLSYINGSPEVLPSASFFMFCV